MTIAPPRLYLSAAHKSSGKTTLAIGLCAALRASGLTVQPFKKGPDFIDPLWLGEAAGRPCHNLDFYTQEPREILTNLGRYGPSADLVIVEGNKGLYDGLDLDGSNSNAALANLLACPVILVLDTRGMTRGIAPLLQGYVNFPGAPRIAGVILNQVGGPRHESKLRAAVAEYTDLPVVGALPRDPDLAIDERHLGLVPSNEQPMARDLLQKLATAVSAHVDLAELRALAAQAPDLAVDSPPMPAMPTPDSRVGILRDAAFGFYYPGDLDALRAAGAELVFLDALRDSALPPLDGLFIGGGFPETHAADLAANQSLKTAVRQAVTAGLPVYAECGGLMYLARTLTWGGQSWDMAGALPLDTVMHPKPQGRGYVRLQETEHAPWPNPLPEPFPAHEFHHSSARNLAPDARFAYRVLRGHGITGAEDGLVVRNTLASYAHLRDVEGHAWTRRFMAFIRAAKG